MSPAPLRPPRPDSEFMLRAVAPRTGESTRSRNQRRVAVPRSQARKIIKVPKLNSKTTLRSPSHTHSKCWRKCVGMSVAIFDSADRRQRRISRSCVTTRVASRQIDDERQPGSWVRFSGGRHQSYPSEIAERMLRTIDSFFVQVESVFSDTSGSERKWAAKSCRKARDCLRGPSSRPVSPTGQSPALELRGYSDDRRNRSRLKRWASHFRTGRPSQIWRGNHGRGFPQLRDALLDDLRTH